MKKMINKIIAEGFLYDQSLKESDKNYINGKMNVLTSIGADSSTDTCELKIIAGPTYGNKPGAKANPNYYNFKSVMTQEEKTYLKVGTEALGVSVTGSFDVSYFVPKGTDITRENIVSNVQNRGSFITIMDGKTIETPSATFDTDIYVTEIVPEMTKVAADSDEPSVETGNILVKGYIFDFKNTAMPITYIAKKSEEQGVLSAADYFSSMESELPFLTRAWGKIHTYETKVEKKEESAFGAPKIVSFKTTKRELELTGALAEPYEDGITPEEFQAALQARETRIAEALEDQIRRQGATATPTSAFGTAETPASVASSFQGLGGKGFIY